MSPFLGSGSKVQVVFVSADRTIPDMLSYMKEAHGNWPAVPPGSALQKFVFSLYINSKYPTIIMNS